MNHVQNKPKFHTPYETLMPDDLRWRWDGDASTGEQLQIQITISREVWLHSESHSVLQTLCDPTRTIQSMEFSRPQYWSE